MRCVLRALALYQRDGDERALDLRIEASLERRPFPRAVKGAILATYLIGEAMRSLGAAVLRTVAALEPLLKETSIAPIPSKGSAPKLK